MRILTTTLFLSCVFLFGFAQPELAFERGYDIPVVEDGINLKSAWAGGINAAQFSEIDLNQDGIKDIFIFDRSGNRILTFINTNNDEGQMEYEFTHEFNESFPPLSEWCLLRDINCDGKSDIFTKAPNSMKVYLNTSNEIDGLQFEIYQEILNAEYNYSGVPFTAPVYSVTIDIPAIDDLDGDGDLDILTFSEIASTLYYYENIAIQPEEGNDDCSQPEFRLSNRCYGFINEASENNTIFIGDDHVCDFNVIDPRAHEEGNDRLHTGGTLLTLDVNADDFKEIVIADVSFNNLKLLLTGPSDQGPDSVYTVLTDFPASFQTTTAVDIHVFPSAFYEDVNNDGVKDLIVSTNNGATSEDDESMWLYLNNGEDNLPDFEFIKTNFLQDEMIEVGRGSFPVFADYNADGLPDLFVSNEKYYEVGAQPPSRIALYENTGTADSPEFTLITKNYEELDQFNLLSMYPSFIDLDADNDLDMLIGDQGGKLHFFRNIAGPGATFDFELDTPNFADTFGDPIDVGQFATPLPFDLDQDGKMDLLIGEKNGNINYYRNVGAVSADFELETETLGDVVASNYLGINGVSVPRFFVDDDNEIKLILGTETGVLNYYGNISGNLDGTFDLIEENLGEIREGDRSAPAVFDLNNDGFIDILYGLNGGGIAYYKGIDPTTFVYEQRKKERIKVYPNPANTNVSFQLPDSKGLVQLMFYDLTGRMVDEKSVFNTNGLDISNLSEGMYEVVIISNEKKYYSKILIAR